MWQTNEHFKVKMCKSHLDWACKSHLGAQLLESLISILSLVSSWNKLQYSLHFYKKNIRIMFSNKKVKSQKIISRRYHFQKWQAPALLTHISGGRFLGSFCGSKKKKGNDFFFFLLAKGFKMSTEWCLEVLASLSFWILASASLGV